MIAQALRRASTCTPRSLCDRREGGVCARPPGRSPRVSRRLCARHLPRRRLPGRTSSDRVRRDRRAAVGQRGDARRRTGDVAPEPRHLLRRRSRSAVRHRSVLPHSDRGAARIDRARHGLRVDAGARATSCSGRAWESASGRRRRRTRSRRCSSSQRAREPRRELRGVGAVHLHLTIHGTEDCSRYPTRTASPEPCASSRAGEAGRRSLHVAGRAGCTRDRAARHGRGDRGGNAAPRIQMLGAHTVEVVRHPEGGRRRSSGGDQSRITVPEPLRSTQRTRTQRAAEVPLDLTAPRVRSRSAAAKAQSNATPPVSRAASRAGQHRSGFGVALGGDTSGASTSTAENGATK